MTWKNRQTREKGDRMIELRGEGLHIKCDVCNNEGGWEFEHVYDQIDDEVIETFYVCVKCGAYLIGEFTADEWFGKQDDKESQDDDE
jgi:DNA-directed RNA polymerase subunit M/transcription elongation factor TFIIS